MTVCFMNHVYLCYLPAHCSHGLQPLDNGIFNVLKAAYRKELERLACLTDSAPVDKVNFIRAYAQARKMAFSSKNILSGWRVTGNWPISRAKALRHTEIQPDKETVIPRAKAIGPELGDGETPKFGRQIRDMAKSKTPGTRHRYAVIAKGFEAQEVELVAQATRISSLEEEVARLQRGKKRKAIPNPNKRFMTLVEALGSNDPIPKVSDEESLIEVDSSTEEEEVDSEGETLSEIEVAFPPQSPPRMLRSGRVVKKTRFE
jgi:hypothetical protein